MPSENQSSMKIPSASWPDVRETFFTHHVLMPSNAIPLILSMRPSKKKGVLSQHFFHYMLAHWGKFQVLLVGLSNEQAVDM